MKLLVIAVFLGLAFALPSSKNADFKNGLFSHSKYHRYSEINDILSGLETTYGSDIVSTGSLTQHTAEGRPIPFVKISGGVGFNKKRVFIEAGIHGREWIGTASALYFLDRLLERRTLDSDASFLFNNFDWYIVPLANPDGYEFTHTSDRNWRKNRRYMFAAECGTTMHGVDLNRNFDAEWSGSGSSSNCNADTYHGPNVFSEAESAAIRTKVQEIQNNDGAISAYISLSAYGQTLYTPYSYTTSLPANHNAAVTISDKAREAIQAATGKSYTVGAAGASTYVASGTSTDWAFMKANIGYSLAFALRPEVGDSHGFDLPPSEIVPSGIDVWAGLHAVASNL